MQLEDYTKLVLSKRPSWRFNTHTITQYSNQQNHRQSACHSVIRNSDISSTS